MSHIVSIKSRLKDPLAIQAACRRLNLEMPVEGEAQLFSATVTGLLVRLPEWQYPVVVDLASGNIQYDDYGGKWGNRAFLDQFLQAYAVEVCRLEARKKGMLVTEQPLQDGSIKLQLTTAG